MTISAKKDGWHFVRHEVMGVNPTDGKTYCLAYFTKGDRKQSHPFGFKALPPASDLPKFFAEQADKVCV